MMSQQYCVDKDVNESNESINQMVLKTNKMKNPSDCEVYDEFKIL